MQVREIFGSERLRVRTTSESDIALLHERIFSVPEVMRFVFNGIPLTPRETDQFVRAKFNFDGADVGLSTLEEKASGEVIGFAGLNACQHLGKDDVEFGFVLAKDVWGKGYALEIGRAQIGYGFNNLRLPVLLASVDPENARSIHVLTKLSLRHEADVTVEGRGLRRIYSIDSSSATGG